MHAGGIGHAKRKALQKVLLGTLGRALAAMAARQRRQPLRFEVCLLSRQSAKPSPDFDLLYDELVARHGADAVAMRTCAPELGNKLSFIANMLDQLRIASKSRVIVLDGYNPVVCIPPASSRTRVVQLWHASGAVKKFGFQAIDTPAGRSSEYARAAHMHENYDVIIAAGPGAIDAYAQAFGYRADQVLPLGMPHLDYLLDSSPDGPRSRRRAQVGAAFPFLSDGNPNIVYAPTLRKGPEHAGWETRFLDRLASACEALSESPAGGANLIFAGHPLDHDFDSSLLDAHPCIKTCPGVATVDLLQDADCVVTDYSSVALEAGLLGCNVCFYVPDLAEYEGSPGLNIDLRDRSLCLASPTAADIISAALDGRAPEFDSWRAFTARYFEGLDSSSTCRIADLIDDLLT